VIIQNQILRYVLTLTAATFLVATSAFAQPTLTVVDNGLNGSSNQEWLVQVAPDASLFGANGGSLALELAFEVDLASTLVSATPNSALFPFMNPGNNPFTGGVTFGVTTNTAANSVFAALGSDLFTSGAAVNVLTIEVSASGPTTLSWGGQTLLPGTPNQFVGSRIAQDAVNFDNYTGSITSSAPPALPCDLDADGDCDFDDIDLLYAGSPSSADISTWLSQASDPANPYKTTVPGGTTADVYVVGDVDLNGDVDSTDLGLLLNNFSSNAGPGWGGGDLDADGSVDSTDLGLHLNNFSFTSAAASAVPEPGSLGLLLLGVFGLVGRARRR